ncbi:MAG: hypothetical protein QGH59_09285, partial [Gemmatimonadota bacterium]|nr:hypothetical protein [Gemmatimonadota bacterium]
MQIKGRFPPRKWLSRVSAVRALRIRERSPDSASSQSGEQSSPKTGRRAIPKERLSWTRGTACGTLSRLKKRPREIDDGREHLSEEDRMASWISRILGKGPGDPIVIISGLPRSGTSMAMKMLDAGGVEIMQDGIRTA